ncbi:hypothetical protein FA15DRAFT_681345 [Coprinopsis marcescibilis]|uniref:Phytanoyl-CoA dioxygenase n=1 Tax=Coprinopsis marcescibilis TaxID=230819 RepID=A0A5C3KRM4_COPMA|nr:hypothetical protein FA15DRAFT_681345 [Coprinopsis marcescibilis]
MAQGYEYLSSEQVSHFLEHGYIVIKEAFTKAKAAQWTANLWVRLGMDPDDKTTWTRERVHMPVHNRELVETFAPKDLLGGDRIDENASTWGDSFIVNLGTDELENEYVVPRDMDNWHVDGDFFVHFIDSPEQALLVVPIFSNISSHGGATYISPDGLELIARYLADHPEGVLPTGLSFTPSTTTCEHPATQDPGYWSHLKEIKRCSKFVELTGEIGDVVLMHPLMLHTASKNYLRVPRVITNPPVGLKEPFNFNREDPNEFSLVERKTLMALGVDKLDFRTSTERRRIVPERVRIQQRMMEEEKARLQALSGVLTDV